MCSLDAVELLLSTGKVDLNVQETFTGKKMNARQYAQHIPVAKVCQQIKTKEKNKNKKVREKTFEWKIIF